MTIFVFSAIRLGHSSKKKNAVRFGCLEDWLKVSSKKIKKKQKKQTDLKTEKFDFVCGSDQPNARINLSKFFLRFFKEIRRSPKKSSLIKKLK